MWTLRNLETINTKLKINIPLYNKSDIDHMIDLVKNACLTNMRYWVQPQHHTKNIIEMVKSFSIDT